MDTTFILDFFEYDRWANARILSAVAKLGDGDFLKDMGSSFPSIRDTLVHILGAQWLWLQRWQGTSPKTLLPAAEFPTLASLRSRWEEFEADQRRFLADITAESLRGNVAYKNLKGESHEYPLGQLVIQVLNHSTYHRGQVITLLRQLKAEVVSTDYVLFIGQRR